jgi:VanZ family protein
VVDEIHQGWVPGRSPSVADVLSDSFGGALAISLIRRHFGLVNRNRAVLAFAVLSAGSVAVATWGPG